MLTVVIMTIGLVLTFNGLASLIWSAEVRAFPSPFPNDTWEVGGVAIREGKIVYVGEAGEARRQGGPRAEVVDLGDRVALPGFVWLDTPAKVLHADERHLEFTEDPPL